MLYTVRQLSQMAGVTVRTLHHYDQIALLKPAQVGANGYRYYDDAALLRLQQILFYRELGLELAQIREILDRPDFDLLAALRSHRRALEERASRLHALVDTIDRTIMHLTGETEMSRKQLFAGFSEEQQKQYEREARLQYGPEIVNESIQRWNSYSPAQKEAIFEEGSAIYSAFAALIDAGIPAQSAEAQAVAARWHAHIRHFYEPIIEILRGLGEHYQSHPDFAANFQRLHAGLPAYLQAVIAQYTDDLETTEIERLLAEDSAARLED